MAFDPSRLYQQLQNLGFQDKNSPHYLFLRSLIQALVSISSTVFGSPSGSGGGGGALASLTYLTVNNESASLPNSRQELAGAHVAFDDSIANQRTVRSSEWGVLSDGHMFAGTEPVYENLTNGDPINPEILFDSNGDVIMTEFRRDAPGIVYDSNGDVIMTEVL